MASAAKIKFPPLLVLEKLTQKSTNCDQFKLCH